MTKFNLTSHVYRQTAQLLSLLYKSSILTGDNLRHNKGDDFSSNLLRL